jgi:hypothetical protein
MVTGSHRFKLDDEPWSLHFGGPLASWSLSILVPYRVSHRRPHGNNASTVHRPYFPWCHHWFEHQRLKGTKLPLATWGLGLQPPWYL